METVLSGSRICLAKYSLIKLWLAAPEVKQEIYPTPLWKAERVEDWKA